MSEEFGTDIISGSYSIFIVDRGQNDGILNMAKSLSDNIFESLYKKGAIVEESMLAIDDCYANIYPPDFHVRSVMRILPKNKFVIFFDPFSTSTEIAKQCHELAKSHPDIAMYFINDGDGYKSLISGRNVTIITYENPRFMAGQILTDDILELFQLDNLSQVAGM